MNWAMNTKLKQVVEVYKINIYLRIYDSVGNDWTYSMDLRMQLTVIHIRLLPCKKPPLNVLLANK